MAEQPSLPSNIDSNILSVTKQLTSLADGWKMMVETIVNLRKEVEELKADKEVTEPTD